MEINMIEDIKQRLRAAEYAYRCLQGNGAYGTTESRLLETFREHVLEDMRYLVDHYAEPEAPSSFALLLARALDRKARELAEAGEQIHDLCVDVRARASSPVRTVTVVFDAGAAEVGPSADSETSAAPLEVDALRAENARLTRERDHLHSAHAAQVARAEKAERERDARPAITAEKVAGWVAAKWPCYFPTLEEKRAWEEVQDVLHAFAEKVAR